MPSKVLIHSPRTWAARTCGRLLSVLILASAAAFAAQTRTAFEVTSVRANASGDRRASIQFTPAGDLRAVNQPVRVLINFAFRIPLFRVEGMPDWFSTERFDVSGVAPAGLKMEPFAEVRSQLLQSLLVDRFKLKARLVTKEVPAMIVSLARADGRLGPRLRRSSVECQTAVAGGARGRGESPPPTPREPVCGLGGSSAGPICGRAVTMTQLTDGLGGVYQRPVVDMTGLEGRFDLDVSFTPDNPGGPGVSFGAVCNSSNADAPTLSTALQEQLGLRIRSGRAPVEVLVIDSVERPTDN
jgi:uncharacterized protein (TIGR03435 family)